MTLEAGVDGPSMRGALFDELEHAVDLELGRFEERGCADAANLLRSLVVGVGGMRDAQDGADEGDPVGAEALGRIDELLPRVRRTLSDLDFVAQINGVLTQAQVTALEMGQMAGGEALDASPEPTPPEDEAAKAAAVNAAALRSFADTLHRGVREPYRAVVATAVERYAAVASAATRCVQALRRLPEGGSDAGAAGVPAPDGSSECLRELEQSLEALVSWLTDAPLGSLREGVRSQIREHAERQSRDRPRGSASIEERVAAFQASWDRLGRPERLQGELERLRYLSRLLRFCAFLDDFVQAKLLAEADRVAGEAIDRLSSAIGDLRASHDEAAETLAKVPNGSGVAPGPLLERGLRALSDVHGALIELTERSMLDAATEGAGALSEEIGRLGAKLEIGPLVAPGEVASVDDDLVTVEPTEWAQDAFDVFLLEGLCETALPYAEGLQTALELIPSAQTVLEYNLGAAIDLADDVDGQAPALRRELVLGGLDRTADRLAKALGELEKIRQSAPVSAALMLEGASEQFWTRARAEHSLEGRARDVWATLSQGAGIAGAWALRGGRQVRESATLLLKQGSARALRTVRRARVAVGAEPVAAERVDATVREIADVDTVASDLPFVYRRLFSYRSVTDESLLIGREETLGKLDRHRDRWEAGQPDAVLIVGSSGVGVSSLVEVARRRWADEVDWCSLVLEERLEDEEAWARTLARALGVSAASLDELQATLEVRPAPERPQVCVIDDLELLYRRGVLDSGLIGATIRLMSATDGCVLWITTLSASAWQVLQVLEPGVAALVRVLPVDPLTRSDVEGAILARHERSGIPLVLDPPAEPPLGLRRGLTRAKDDAERQALLRTAFFDRLYELSDGYMALAILYWLRALRLDRESETMHIGWPGGIDFGAWDGLDSTGAFALRAFLEHGSLTLPEYAGVFGVGEEQALAAFEGLGNLLLIESVGPMRQIGTPLRFRRIEPSSRYRIRPVLVRPVERLLASRRLLY